MRKKLLLKNNALFDEMPGFFQKFLAAGPKRLPGGGKGPFPSSV